MNNNLEFDALVEQYGLEALRQQFRWIGPINLSQVDTIESKVDGSLISTYEHNGIACLKSKGSLSSDQAINATNWLHDKSNSALCDAIQLLVELGYTVNMEWVSPDNRIVIGYKYPKLHVLNVRDMNNGNYLSRDMIKSYIPQKYIVPCVDMNGLNPAEFVQSIPDMTDNIEGFVARIGDLWFKVKTTKYLSLHHNKDSINNPRRLFEAILDEAVDDLRVMFFDDDLAIKQIDEMTKKVDLLYNNMVSVVEQFYNDNKELTRKEYAIKGQSEIPRLYFSLAMNKYLNKDPNYKQFMKSKYKELGFRDINTHSDEDQE